MRDVAIIVFMLLILKIPLVYVCWIMWWAVKSEPEVGSGGDSFDSVPWKPWQNPSGSRPPRNGPHGVPARASGRPANRERKATT
jgi:hypothetical protein